MNLLAIDPSSTCVGAAVFRPEKSMEAFRLKPEKASAPAEDRVTSMIRELKAIVEDFDIDTVVIEEPAKNAFKGRSKHNYVVQRAYGRIYQAMLEKGVVVNSVPVSEWTRSVGKATRASVIKNLDADVDKGLDGADAIGIGQWWLNRQRGVPSLAK